MKLRNIPILLLTYFCFGIVTRLCAAPPARPASQPALPTPTISNEHYGPHERNVLDLWETESAQPTPLLIYIHGGGFIAGDKSSLSADLLRRCQEIGISVAAINYRYSTQASFPAPFMDCARAVQFLRLHAAEWNLDPKHFACTGGSAGAGMSLWLAFHDDLADPKSEDPVLRESTRLSCAAVTAAQCSYDPRFIREQIGGRAWQHPALPMLYGLPPGDFDDPKAYKMYEDAAAINFVTPDDPPVFLYYNEPDVPLPPDSKPGAGIHHPKFGKVLKEKMDAMKIECVLHLTEDYTANGPLRGGVMAPMHTDMVDFLQKHLKGKP